MKARRAFAPPALSVLALSIVGGLLSSGCGGEKKKTTEPPVEVPRGGLSGQVALVSNLFAESGEKTGERTITDVDSLRIYLLSPTAGTEDAPLDSTWAIDGAYRFDSPESGSYRVGVHVARWRWVPSEPFAWQDSTSVVPLFTVRPQGPLENPPNPFVGAAGVGLQGSLDQAQFLTTEGITMSGHTKFFYEYKAPVGFFHIHMYPLPPEPVFSPGIYWGVVRWENDGWFNIVIAE